jgi:hypothetical protein
MKQHSPINPLKLMNETKKSDDERVNPKSYIKKGFWISLGAAAGICMTAASIMIISKIPAFINATIPAYTVLTERYEPCDIGGYCKIPLSKRIQSAFGTLKYCLFQDKSWCKGWGKNGNTF